MTDSKEQDRKTLSLGSAKPKLPSDTVFMPKPWRALEILKQAERVQ